MIVELTDTRKHWLPDPLARAFCYVLGPVSALTMLGSRHYAGVWAIRFHAFHSLLMTGLWASVWSALRGLEHLSPWLLSSIIRELRFVVNIGFGVVWVVLLLTAINGERCATVPLVHTLAVRLARKFHPPQCV